MHIHRPKVFHRLTEFLREIFIIVVGILIALGLEEVVRVVHDRAIARDAREAVRAEIRQNLSYMKARMETQPCVERRLNEVGDLLAKAGDGPLPLLPQPKWIGQPSIWFMADQSWKAATGSGRASLFSPHDLIGFTGIYVEAAAFRAAEDREQLAWAQLRALENWNGPLGPVARMHFISALQSARYAFWEIRVDAEVAFQRAETMGIGGLRPAAAVQGYAIPHAVCLPIDTPRDKALGLLSGDSPPWGQPE